MPHSLFTEPDKKLLLQIARSCLVAAAAGNPYRPGNLSSYPVRLQQPGACFVTLTLSGRLRGCIGSLEPHRPLVEDVAENTRAAATRDPRFPPVTPDEAEKIEIEISVLGPLEPIPCATEEKLLEQLVPFRDGLVIEDGYHRATFLPLVWEQLPEKQIFLQQLKRKAGMPDDYWSSSLRCYRYQTEILLESR